MAISDMVLPKPKRIEERPGWFELPEPIVISLQCQGSGAVEAIADSLHARLTQAGYGAKRALKLSGTGVIELQCSPGPNPDAYRLSVTPEGVKITGGGDPGLFYGTRTLLQLVEDGKIPCCEIEDGPDYMNRMVMYDLAREQTCNMAHLKHVIDVLADHKVNMLHLYFENRFQFARHPEVSPPGVMTPDQARELDEYARARFVELVPEVNCLAHLENALCVEKYKHLSEDPEHTYEICTLNPEAVEFVKDLVTEVAECFTSSYFHMGGDESSYMGNCPKCAEKIEQVGKHQMFAEHYTKIAEFIKSIGKKPMMWGDMLLHYRGAAELMPKDIIIFDWHYDETTVDTVKYFTGQGFEVYACPAMSGFGRLAAPYSHATGNIYKFIGEGKEGGAIGECTCAWEQRLGHYFTNDYFGILLSADRSWNLGAGDLADYEKRFCKAFFGLDDPRPIAYYKELSDGYASIFEDKIPRSSWLAFEPWQHETDRDLGQYVSQELLARSDQELAELARLLDDLKKSVKRNVDALDFADVPAHSAHMMLRKLAFFRQATLLIAEAREQKANDADAADFKLLQAMGLLKEIDKDMDYFEQRFTDAVAKHGSSTDDLKRIATIRAAAAAKKAEAKGLMSE